MVIGYCESPFVAQIFDKCYSRGEPQLSPHQKVQLNGGVPAKNAIKQLNIRQPVKYDRFSDLTLQYQN